MSTSRHHARLPEDDAGCSPTSLKSANPANRDSNGTEFPNYGHGDGNSCDCDDLGNVDDEAAAPALDFDTKTLPDIESVSAYRGIGQDTSSRIARYALNAAFFTLDGQSAILSHAPFVIGDTDEGNNASPIGTFSLDEKLFAIGTHLPIVMDGPQAPYEPSDIRPDILEELTRFEKAFASTFVTTRPTT